MTIYPPIQTCFCFVTQSTSNQQRRVTVNGPKERSPPHIDEGGGVEGGAGLEERVMNQKNAVVGRGYLFSVEICIIYC